MVVRETENNFDAKCFQENKLHYLYKSGYPLSDVNVLPNTLAPDRSLSHGHYIIIQRFNNLTRGGVRQWGTI